MSKQLITFLCLSVFGLITSLTYPSYASAQGHPGRCNPGEREVFECFQNFSGGQTFWEPTFSNFCENDNDANQCTLVSSIPGCDEEEDYCCIPCQTALPNNECENDQDCSEKNIAGCTGSDCSCQRGVCKKKAGKNCAEDATRCEDNLTCRDAICGYQAHSRGVGQSCFIDLECTQVDATSGNFVTCISGKCELTTNPEDNPDDDKETSPTTYDFELCEQIPNGVSKELCKGCWRRKGIWTAIGCIDTNPTQMISTLMTIGLSISGGVALLMILAAGFMFSTSQGDPKKVSEAKELMTSAVIGLLFIIFSVTILQFIGINLLQIPGFGG